MKTHTWCVPRQKHNNPTWTLLHSFWALIYLFFLKITCCVNSWVFVFLLVIISLFVWFPVSNTDLLHWCAVALTVIHSSSLTNRITAKRKKISPAAQSHLLTWEQWAARRGHVRTIPSSGEYPPFLLCFDQMLCEMVDGWLWDGSHWWAEEVEIEKQRV